jgi:transposase
MAASVGPKKIQRYSLEFKRGAVKLTQAPGMEVQVVARALDIHPVMLSRWRQEAREGRLGAMKRQPPSPKGRVRELRRLQELERAYALLLQEHELLKKAIRFSSARRPMSSRSSRTSGDRSR